MSRLKYVVAVLGISTLLGSYYALASYSANTATAHAVVTNANSLHANWVMITSSLGIDPRSTKPGSLVPVLKEQHGALDWLIYGEHVMEEPYKNGFSELGVHAIMNDIHVSNDKGQLIYNVSGTKLNMISVLDDGTVAIFYSRAYKPIIEALLREYDPVPFDKVGKNTGMIRYGSMGNGEYAVGIYFLKT